MHKKDSHAIIDILHNFVCAVCKKLLYNNWMMTTYYRINSTNISQALLLLLVVVAQAEHIHPLLPHMKEIAWL